MEEFLTSKPISLNEEELIDVKRRKEMDAVRIEEQKRFYEIARQRAAELDVYMEQFRRDIVESSMSLVLSLQCLECHTNMLLLDGLTKLFAEIREKPCIAELSPQYQKFAEWLRIE